MGVVVEIEINTMDILTAAEGAYKQGLEMCGLTAEGYAKRLCPVDTGALRNSITHQVDNKSCIIGTNMEYAPYIELGTGIYYPGGRQTPWTYKDGRGNWHWTRGNPAHPYLKPAIADHAEEYRNLIESALKGGG